MSDSVVVLPNENKWTEFRVPNHTQQTGLELDRRLCEQSITLVALLKTFMSDLPRRLAPKISSNVLLSRRSQSSACFMGCLHYYRRLLHWRDTMGDKMKYWTELDQFMHASRDHSIADECQNCSRPC